MNVKRVIELKKWMLEKGIKQIDVARKAGVTGTAVFLLINGRMVSANIKNALLELGCPPELLTKEAA